MNDGGGAVGAAGASGTTGTGGATALAGSTGAEAGAAGVDAAAPGTADADGGVADASADGELGAADATPPLSTLPAPACARPAPTGIWFERACGPQVMGVAIDPFAPNHQVGYRFESNGPLYLLVATTDDGWASQRAVDGEVRSAAEPRVDPVSGKLWIADPETYDLVLWSPSSRKVVRAHGGFYGISGELTKTPSLFLPGDDLTSTFELSRDGGATWQPMTFPPLEPAEKNEYRLRSAVGDPNDARRVWMLESVRHEDAKHLPRYVPVLARSEDGGATWTQCRRFLDDDNYVRFGVGHRGVLYAVTTKTDLGATTMRSDDGCATWTALTKTCRLLSVDPGSDTVYCVEAGSERLWRSADRGRGWQPIDAGQVGVFSVAWAASTPDTVFVSAATGLLRGERAGSSWTRLSSWEPPELQDLLAVDRNLYAWFGATSPLAPQSMIPVVSKDVGRSWEVLPIETRSETEIPPKLLLHFGQVTTAETFRDVKNGAYYLGDPALGLGYWGDAVALDFGNSLTAFPPIADDAAPFFLIASPPPHANVAYAHLLPEEGRRDLAVSHDAGRSWARVPTKICGKSGIDPNDAILAVSGVDPDVFYLWSPSCPDALVTQQRSDGTLVGRVDVTFAPGADSQVVEAEPGLMLVFTPLVGSGGRAGSARAFTHHLGASWTKASAEVRKRFVEGVLLFDGLTNDPARPEVVHAGARSFVFPSP
jgi:hypothetical protein